MGRARGCGAARALRVGAACAACVVLAVAAASAVVLPVCAAARARAGGARGQTLPHEPPAVDCFAFPPARDVTNDGNEYRRGQVVVGVGTRPAYVSLLPTTAVCGVWLVGDTAPSETWTAVGDATCGLGTDVVWLGATPVLAPVRRFRTAGDAAACAGAADARVTAALAEAGRFAVIGGLLGLCRDWPWASGGGGATAASAACGRLVFCGADAARRALSATDARHVGTFAAAEAPAEDGWWRLALCGAPADALRGDLARRFYGVADVYAAPATNSTCAAGGAAVALVDPVAQRRASSSETDCPRCRPQLTPGGGSGGHTLLQQDDGGGVYTAVLAAPSDGVPVRVHVLRLAGALCNRWDLCTGVLLVTTLFPAALYFFVGAVPVHGHAVLAALQTSAWLLVPAAASQRNVLAGAGAEVPPALSARRAAALGLCSSAALVASAAATLFCRGRLVRGRPETLAEALAAARWRTAALAWSCTQLVLVLAPIATPTMPPLARAAGVAAPVVAAVPLCAAAVHMCTVWAFRAWHPRHYARAAGPAPRRAACAAAAELAVSAAVAAAVAAVAAAEDWAVLVDLVLHASVPAAAPAAPPRTAAAAAALAALATVGCTLSALAVSRAVPFDKDRLVCEEWLRRNSHVRAALAVF